MQFYDACKSDAGWNPFYRAMSFVYYMAVRTCGAAYFHYGKERGMEDLVAELERKKAQ